MNLRSYYFRLRTAPAVALFLSIVIGLKQNGDVRSADFRTDFATGCH